MTMSISGYRGILLALVGCSACGVFQSDPIDPESDEDASKVVVNTESEAAQRQFAANVTMASRYTPRCSGSRNRPKVLVTGFGRFMSIADNATGRIVSTLVPSARYPKTSAPAEGKVDPPEPQLSVSTETLTLPGVGAVDVCAMILPVYWDLAAIFIAKEVDAFKPSFVLMNGVAGPKQPIWIELGATNEARGLEDGSNQLRPDDQDGKANAKLIEGLSENETLQGNLLSWKAVAASASAAVAQHAKDIDKGERFGDVLQGVKLTSFPRSSNTYICNNVTFVTGWLMNHPNRTIPLLRASKPVSGVADSVPIKMTKDFTKVPRVFVHWPSELADKHHAAGAEVMKAILAGQLKALSDGDMPTVGDNALATLVETGGGAHF
jgi:hypothetical protein